MALMLKLIVSRNNRGLDSVQQPWTQTLLESLPPGGSLFFQHYNFVFSLRAVKGAMVSQLTYLEHLTRTVATENRFSLLFEYNSDKYGSRDQIIYLVWVFRKNNLTNFPFLGFTRLRNSMDSGYRVLEMNRVPIQ